MFVRLQIRRLDQISSMDTPPMWGGSLEFSSLKNQLSARSALTSLQDGQAAAIFSRQSVPPFDFGVR